MAYEQISDDGNYKGIRTIVGGQVAADNLLTNFIKEKNTRKAILDVKKIRAIEAYKNKTN